MIRDCWREKKKVFGSKIVSHFLVSFWAAWCASRPSERLLRLLQSIISVFCRPPNHLTQTDPLEVGSPSGPLTIFPGQASQPLVAPQIKSPNLKFAWLSAAKLVEGTGEICEADIESSDSMTSIAIGFIVFTGGDSFSKSKSLFPTVSSSLGVSSTKGLELPDAADSANFRLVSCQFILILRHRDHD